MEKTLTFYSSGKLLITGEYAVIDGAKALALPTTLGQSLEVLATSKNKIEWTALETNGNQWYHEVFSIKDFTPASPKNPISQRLSQLLREARNHQPDFLMQSQGVHVKTQLEFEREWGLGSSSTLVNNIAQWANIDAYLLQKKVFGGSGYDIACAKKQSPILFQRIAGNPVVKDVAFWPDFYENLFFIHLNQKQNSRLAISKHYNGSSSSQISAINQLTEAFLSAKTLNDFQKNMVDHENIISKLTGHAPVQQKLFSDYDGVVKSLGAWGGDFVLACGPKESPDYFKQKGYTTILPFDKIISRES
jgi:mevalonate kinase